MILFLLSLATAALVYLWYNLRAQNYRRHIARMKIKREAFSAFCLQGVASKFAAARMMEAGIDNTELWPHALLIAPAVAFANRHTTPPSGEHLWIFGTRRLEQ